MAPYLWPFIRLWDWRRFLFIGLPNVYQLYRIYLIGNELPGSGSLAIVSQWQFAGLLREQRRERRPGQSQTGTERVNGAR